MDLKQGNTFIAGHVAEEMVTGGILEDTKTANDTSWSSKQIMDSLINDHNTSSTTTWSSQGLLDRLQIWQEVPIQDFLTLSTDFTIKDNQTYVAINPLLRMVSFCVAAVSLKSYAANTYFIPFTINEGYRPMGTTMACFGGVYDNRGYTGHINNGGTVWVLSPQATPANEEIIISSFWFY